MIDREGIPFVAAAALLTAAGVFWSRWLLIPAVPLLLFFLNFFRDPRRVPPEEDAAVSPADGKVILVKEIDPAAHDGYTVFVSIFMNVLDVHVNRVPIAGTITQYRHYPGKFRPAFEEDASLENERNIIVIEENSRRIRFSQVAGILARRIVFRRRVGDRLQRGERFGMIRFGSRVDLWFPPDFRVTVQPGQRVRAGVSVIAKPKDGQ